MIVHNFRVKFYDTRCFEKITMTILLKGPIRHSFVHYWNKWYGKELYTCADFSAIVGLRSNIS